MLTDGQKKALHSAARQAGVTEPERRTIQRGLGGFFSAADKEAGRHGFIAVMAHYERCCGGLLVGCTRDYWKRQDELSNPLDALKFKVRQAAVDLAWLPDDLDAFIFGPHMTSGLYRSVEDCPAYWLTRTLDALRAIKARKTHDALS